MAMLSIVTINYNGSEKTLKLLESLNNQTDKDFNVLILDNGSEFSDFEKILLMTSQVIIMTCDVIRSEKNLGFGMGINLLAEKAFKTDTDWVLVLNNDIALDNDFISLLKPNLKPENDIIGISLDEGRRTAHAGQIQWLKPTLSHIYEPPNTVVKHSVSNTYAVGGAFAIKKNVFEKLGGFDYHYFLYFEDADLSIRARRNGFNIKFLESPVAHHGEVSYSGKKLGSPMLLRLHYRNALYFNLKNGPWYIKLALWPWSWIIVAKQLVKIAMSKNTEESKEILAGVIDFYKRKFGKI